MPFWVVLVLALFTYQTVGPAWAVAVAVRMRMVMMSVARGMMRYRACVRMGVS